MIISLKTLPHVLLARQVTSEYTFFLGCEKEVKEGSDGDSEEQKKESIMRLSWALVHSRQAEDIQRGLAMLEGIVFTKFIQLTSNPNALI